MTQRIDPSTSRHISNEEFSGDRRKKALQLARERAGFDSGAWDTMNWYVRFAELDFDNLSDGDLRNFQEEVVALCEVIEKGGYRPLLTRTGLVTLQKEIAKHLKSLVDRGRADFGTFSYTVVIYRLQEMLEKCQDFNPEGIKNAPKVAVSKKFTHCTTPESFISSILLNHMIDLLGDFAASIIRCLKCEKIFLQFRRQAKCCSRKCQSRRAAEVNRQEKKSKVAKGKRSPKNRQGSATKRRK